MPEKIKKHRNRNSYLLGPNNTWVRNFCASSIIPEVDINNLIAKEDMSLMIGNELVNRQYRFPDIAGERISTNNVAIVSNGFNFIQEQELLADIPNITIIGVNKCLSLWKIINKKPINYYVVNNPYQECLSLIPAKSKYFPTCIASTRTNPEFLKKYNGTRYVYYPTNNQHYSGMPGDDYKIDDYRNPVCAALGLAFKFGAQKIMLFCCDDVFEDERHSAIQLENKLWTYPQQLISDGLIDANLFWLKTAGVKTGNHSQGSKLTNAAYIPSEDIKRFFEDES